MKELELPLGYRLDSSDPDIIKLMYYTQLVANFTKHAEPELIEKVADAHNLEGVPSKKLIARALPAKKL